MVWGRMIGVWAALAVVGACGDDEAGDSSGESGAMVTSSATGTATSAGSATEPGDGGSTAAGSTGSAGSGGEPVVCGELMCEAGQYCVAPCCGGAPEPTDGCTPPPAFCVDVAEVECNEAGCQAEGCFGELVEGVIQCACA